MTNKITLQVVGENGQKTPFTIQTEKENYINSIIEVGKNNEISENDKVKLLEIAGRSGDLNTIETSDLSLDDKINYANYCGYDKFYSFKVSKNGKYLEVTVKETSALTANPNLGNIKDDFLGGKSNILVTKEEIPHENSNLIERKAPYGARENYDEITLMPGETINIPIEHLQFNESPRSWLARLLN